MGRLALVTRPRAQGEGWLRRLTALGVRAALLPLIDISPAPDPAGLRRWADTLADSARDPAALVMFVSPNAAQGLFDALPPGWHWPASTWAGATGPGTAAALRAAGVPDEAVMVPAPDSAQFDSEALWALLEPRRSWAGARAAIVRGDGGRDWLADQLRAAGARVEFVQSYSRRAPQLGTEERQLLASAIAEPASVAWLMSSSEAVEHLWALAPTASWADALALASHPRIAESARGLGFGRVVEVRPTPEAVAEALAGL
jgi:uroporphyrinogen-III synthase